jgi:hypothetical protein
MGLQFPQITLDKGKFFHEGGKPRDIQKAFDFAVEIWRLLSDQGMIISEIKLTLEPNHTPREGLIFLTLDFDIEWCHLLEARRCSLAFRNWECESIGDMEKLAREKAAELIKNLLHSARYIEENVAYSIGELARTLAALEVPISAPAPKA